MSSQVSPPESDTLSVPLRQGTAFGASCIQGREQGSGDCTAPAGTGLGKGPGPVLPARPAPLGDQTAAVGRQPHVAPSERAALP